MDGYRIVFSTIMGRKHDGKQVHEWLVSKAKEIGIEGVTVVAGMKGFGRDKSIHSTGFFELADQPVEVIMLAQGEKTKKLFEVISEAKLDVFYSKTQAEFGFTKH